MSRTVSVLVLLRACMLAPTSSAFTNLLHAHHRTGVKDRAAWNPSGRVVFPVIWREATTSSEVDADQELLEIQGARKEMMAGLYAKVEPGSKQEKFLTITDYFMTDYGDSVYEAGFGKDYFVRVVGGLLTNMGKQLKKPHKFELFHKSIRGPDYDYYDFGTSFVRPLIIKENSRTRGLETLAELDASIKAGDNVIIVGNHQTELDPQIISVLLEEEGYSELAEKMIFVAGHRVTEDPLAIPFSMGRNLLCIHSKKHLENPPEEKPAKQAQNLGTMSKVSELLTEGGNCIWLAASGGRDRPNQETKQFEVSPFDAKAVELFRLMAKKANMMAATKKGDKAPVTRFMPLAMFTHQLVPPPDEVNSALGETRTAKRGSVSIGFVPEVSDEALAEAVSKAETKEGKRAAYTACMQSGVKEMYEELVRLSSS